MSTNKTTTAVATQQELEMMLEPIPSVKRKPVFLLFAEFLGYATPLIEWAEDICKKDHVEDFKQKLIDVDASVIFNKMKDEFGLEYIKEAWKDLYPPILEEYDSALIAKNNLDELPF
jgi:hypothetical protein